MLGKKKSLGKREKRNALEVSVIVVDVGHGNGPSMGTHYTVPTPPQPCSRAGEVLLQKVSDSS